MREQNDDLIIKPCDICGGTDAVDTVLSSINLVLGFGSIYDGERVSLDICGECADKIYELFKEVQRRNNIGKSTSS